METDSFPQQSGKDKNIREILADPRFLEEINNEKYSEPVSFEIFRCWSKKFRCRVCSSFYKINLVKINSIFSSTCIITRSLHIEKRLTFPSSSFKTPFSWLLDSRVFYQILCFGFFNAISPTKFYVSNLPDLIRCYLTAIGYYVMTPYLSTMPYNSMMPT